MAVTIIILSLVAVANTVLFVWAAKRSLAAFTFERRLSETERRLAAKSIELEVERVKNATVVHVPASGTHRGLLDDKTIALVRLAVLNPEKREGESAAMIVCKRLKEKIDG